MKLWGTLFGVAFGFVLAWGRVADYDTIKRMLLLQDPYVFLMMGSGVGTALLGLRLLRRFGARTWTAPAAPVAWTPSRIERRHVVGSAIFGVGWAVCGACPGPVAVQLGQGRFAAVFTALGIVSGIVLAGWLAERGRAVALDGAGREAA